MASVNSATIKVNLVPGSINVGLDPKVIKGTATVPSRVQGLQGEKGDPGVWYGVDPPPDDSYTVWIKPDGSKYENGIWLGSGPVPEGYNVWIDPNGEGQTIVNSVNDKTGHVKLDAGDVGAIDASELLTNSDILAIWNSF